MANLSFNYLHVIDEFFTARLAGFLILSSLALHIGQLTFEALDVAGVGLGMKVSQGKTVPADTLDQSTVDRMNKISMINLTGLRKHLKAFWTSVLATRKALISA